MSKFLKRQIVAGNLQFSMKGLQKSKKMPFICFLLTLMVSLFSFYISSIKLCKFRQNSHRIYDEFKNIGIVYMIILYDLKSLHQTPIIYRYIQSAMMRYFMLLGCCLVINCDLPLSNTSYILTSQTLWTSCSL